MENEKGFSLIEILISLAILGIIAVGLLTSLGMATKVLMSTDEGETARDLAVAEMEYIKRLRFEPDATSYPASSSGVRNEVTYPDPGNLNKQLITVSVDYKVYRAEEIITRTFILENYKVVNR